MDRDRVPWVLAAVGVMVLALLAGPAGSHVNNDLAHLKKHLNETYAKKAKVFTKQQVNKNFFGKSTRVINERDSVAANTGEVKEVDCPNGFQAVGGGWSSTNQGVIRDNGSGPLIAGEDDPGATDAGTYSHATGWKFSLFNFSGAEEDYGATVICAKPAG